MSQILISSPFCQTFSFSIKSPTTPLEILFSHLKDLKTKILEHLDTNNLFFTLNNKPILGTLVLNNQNNLQNLKIFPKLNGGKGGFGSQMKKEAMSQKKITNWDASRSLDGRRIRDINNEKNLIKFYKKQKQEQEKIDKELEEYKEMQKINGEKNFGYVVKNDYKEKCEKVENSIQKALKQVLNCKKNNSEKSTSPSQDQNNNDEFQFQIPKKVKPQEIIENDNLQKNLQQEQQKEQKLVAIQQNDSFPQIELEKMNSIQDLINLGDAYLKNELMRLGLKCGGKIEEKANRLWLIKEDSQNLFNPKLLAKK